MPDGPVKGDVPNGGCGYVKGKGYSSCLLVGNVYMLC